MKNDQVYFFTAINCLFFITILIVIIVKRDKFKKYGAQEEKHLSHNGHSINMRDQEQIKTSISRELHDNIGQLLSVAQMNMYYLSKETNGDFRNNKVAKDTISIINQIRDSVQDISHKLNSDYIGRQGLIKLLRQEVRNLKIIKNINADLLVDGIEVPLKKNVELTVFRMVQEALQNIFKHSKADEVVIRLSYYDDSFELSVSDNGIGFNTEEVLNTENTGIGISGMYERARSVGGNLEITSSGKGTTVKMMLPDYAFEAGMINA